MSDSFEKLKPSRLKRELIPFIIIALITFSSFIYFSYQDSTGSIAYSPEVPIINIDISSEITNYSQQCFLKISPISNEFVKSGWANRFLAADIRKRDSDGGFSIELYQSENLFQIRDDDDWLLLPQGKYLDSLRTKMAFDIFNMIKDDNSNYRLPHSKLIEVFVNGNYKGLYLLCERIDRKLLNLERISFIVTFKQKTKLLSVKKGGGFSRESGSKVKLLSEVQKIPYISNVKVIEGSNSVEI